MKRGEHERKYRIHKLLYLAPSTVPGRGVEGGSQPVPSFEQ